MRLVSTLFLLLLVCFGIAQSKPAIVSGTVMDKDSRPISGVVVGVIGNSKISVTNTEGFFKIKIVAFKNVEINAKHLGYSIFKKKYKNLKPGEERRLNIILKEQSITGKTVTVVRKSESTPSSFLKLKTKKFQGFVNPSGNIESIIKTLPGVSSNNELSSQYNVRGGNFDENLIYVNGIEVFRPLMIRTARNEGLSFINSDMVRDLKFSSGGFGARYGDKMSSVLDVTYKTPEKPEGSAVFDLQGVRLYYGSNYLDKKLSYVISGRYKTNAYVLNSLNTKGSYRPAFFDFQSYITYKLTDKVKLGFLANIADNVYNFTPQTRQTSFGSINEALRLTVFFQGQQINSYRTFFGAFSTDWQVLEKVDLKFIVSGFSSSESQKADIEGFYSIDELERDLGSSAFGNVKFNRGVGSYLNHSRNDLNYMIANLEHRGIWNIKGNKKLQWGSKLQKEIIVDRINDWGFVDSAGYSIPRALQGKGKSQNLSLLKLELNNRLRSAQNVENTKIEGFVQLSDKILSKNGDEHKFNLGARFNYRTFFNELIISPRFYYILKPNWENKFTFRISGGVYYQPPFYKEMRDFDGSINNNIKSQKSIQLILGMSKGFSWSGRPFKLITELYYKQLTNLIPYQIDNVWIRYHAENVSKGYATGLDIRINGELIKGVESWASLSFLRTYENLNNDFYYDYFNSDGKKIIPGFTRNNVAVDSNRIEPGFLPRPTDQLVNFSLFFQDYLNQYPRISVNLLFHYGTGLVYGPPLKKERYKYTARYPDYLRADIGFLYDIRNEKDKMIKRPLKRLKNISVGLQIFNLLQVNNVISYLWLQDVSGRQYAIPNYLTSRQINLKLRIGF